METRLNMCEACAGLNHRVTQLERRLASAAHWPAWFEDINAGLREIEGICTGMGVSIEQFFESSEGSNQANAVRDAVIHELIKRGWSASRIGRVARMSERSVRRVLGRIPRRG